MTHQHYDRMSPSGVPWLGQVPSHWTLRRLGYFFDERREKVSDKEYPPLSVTKNGIVPQLDTAAKTDDGDNRKKVSRGDFVINSRSDRKGSAGVAQLDGSVSLINTVLRPQAECVPRFVHYLLRSAAFQEEFYRYGQGIVADLWTTRYSEMRAILLAMPPLPEQTAIAAFLDRETSKIDALVEGEKRLIELLKEKRQAVISHAVTKGLDPNVRMKPSGVEWLGDVPEHWEVVPTKRVSSLITSGPRGWSDQLRDEGHVFFQSQNIGRAMEVALDDCKRILPADDAESQRAALSIDDVVVCITGARTGAIAHVLDLPEPAYINQHVCLVRPKDIRGRFMAYSLTSRIGQQQLQVAMYGLKQGLSLEDIRATVFLLPPEVGQSEVTAWLDGHTSGIDALVNEAERALLLLGERRSALISAAVTGRIDVRETAIATQDAA